MRFEQFLSKFEDVREDRSGWLAKCPAHTDGNPSLRLDVTANGRILLVCRAGCRTSDVLAAVGHTFFTLAHVRTDDVPRCATPASDGPPPASALAAMRGMLDRWAGALKGSPAERYAADRFGLSRNDAARLGLGYAEHLHGSARLVLPFREPSGAAFGWQARALGDSDLRWAGPANPTTGSWAKLGWFHGTGGHADVIICEGPADALTACAAGYDAVAIRGAALGQNSNVRETLVTWLNGRRGIVAGDGDAAGHGFNESVRRGVTNCRVLPIIVGEDLTSWHQKHPGVWQVAIPAEAGRSEVDYDATNFRLYPERKKELP